MKTTLRFLAPVAALFAACLLQAADSKPTTRVIAIQEVETDDATGYAAWLAKSNDVIKAKLGIDNFYHVFVTSYDGRRSGTVRSVTAAESAAAFAKISAALQDDPALRDIRDHVRGIRKLGSRVLYFAARYDGTYPGSYVFTTLATVSDEAGYLKALDGLRAMFDANGFQDAKINAFRVMAGRTSHTHRVSISLPSNERLAAFLDFAATSASMAEWQAGAAKVRTVVSNFTAHDITK